LEKIILTMSNKEIILISAYTPTKEKENILRTLITQVKQSNLKIALCTHSKTPLDIIDACDYFFYDKHNKVSYDPSIKYYTYFTLNNLKFHFKDPSQSSTHIVPIIQMIYPSLIYLKNLGYKKIHLLEYDSEVLDNSIFSINSKYLNDYDVVTYFYDNPKINANNTDVYFKGVFKSYNLDRIPLEKIPLDETKILSLYKTYFNNKWFPCAERMVYDLLSPNLDIKWIPLSELNPYMKYGISDKISNNSISYENFHIHNGNLHFIAWNKTKDDKLYTVILPNKCIEFPLSPAHWKHINLQTSELKGNLKLFVNNKLKIHLNLNKKEDLEIITKHSKVKTL